MEKKKILSTLCAGAFLLGMAAPVMDFAPEAVQSSAFAAKGTAYTCMKCGRQMTIYSGTAASSFGTYTCNDGTKNHSIKQGRYTVVPEALGAVKQDNRSGNHVEFSNVTTQKKRAIVIQRNKHEQASTLKIVNNGNYDIRVQFPKALLDQKVFKVYAKNMPQTHDFVLKPGKYVQYTVACQGGKSGIKSNPLCSVNLSKPNGVTKSSKASVTFHAGNVIMVKGVSHPNKNDWSCYIDPSN